jgi:hypothetical protein
MSILGELKAALEQRKDLGVLNHHHRAVYLTVADLDALIAAVKLAESCGRIPASANFGRGDAEVFSIAAFKTYRAAKTKELQDEQDRND